MAARSRRLAVLATLLLFGPALAGCASEAPAAQDEPLTQGNTGANGASTPPFTSGGAPQTEAPRPKGTSERWHFHDHWKGNPTITLMDANVTLNATLSEDGTPALSALVALPSGVVVPPETGYLTVNATWDTGAGLVNLTYRPADSQRFFPAGDLSPTEGSIILTTESMCDVPHRQQSLWLFNVSAKPDAERSPGIPAREVRLTIQATIGRPLFIDPPHFDWWKGLDVIPVVSGYEGEPAAAATPATNLTLSPDKHEAHPESARVPIDAGSIVPEGTKSVVVMLNWTATSPAPVKLRVAYRELNLPSEGYLEVAVDGEAQRVFTMPVRAAQTDTTYSNRTTWEFRVVPEGDPAGAFHGTFELTAWATRLAPGEAAARIAGG